MCCEGYARNKKIIINIYIERAPSETFPFNGWDTQYKGLGKLGGSGRLECGVVEDLYLQPGATRGCWQLLAKEKQGGGPVPPTSKRNRLVGLEEEQGKPLSFYLSPEITLASV